jgi:hypothetical protein
MYESPPVTGIIDRVRPHAFGNPQPADGVLDPNDDILVQFNETIDPTAISRDNFSIRGVLNGTALRHGVAVQLDGINDCIQTPAGTRVSAFPMTIEMWVRRTSNGAATLWSQGEDADSSMMIGINGSNNLFFRLDEMIINSSANIQNDGNWHHVAVTCSSTGVVSIYQTGVFNTSGLLDTIVGIPGPMVVGKNAWDNSGGFAGYIHELRIWKTDQTLGQLQSQMLKMLSGNELGLSNLWPMDEGAGTELRDIVRKRHAMLLGDWAILPSGQAMTFDGNDRLDITPSNLIFTRQHNFTLEFWMKSAAGANTQTLLSNGKGDGTDGHEPGWSVSVIPSGNLQVVHGGQSSTLINKDIRDNNWHHVAMVMNRNGNLNTYLDGLLQTSLYGSNFGEFAGAKLFIAARGWPVPGDFSNDQYFTGDLDEIRVWNTVRTREQIQLYMQHRLLGDEPGLLMYLPFEGYEDVNGIAILTPNLMDVSESMLALDVFGNPMHQVQDPNIKLPRPVVDINFTYSVNNDKIILTLQEDPVRVENIVLDISAMGLRDLRGNEMAGPITWTAYVNKNQLHWNESELSFEKPEKQPLTFDAEIENTGGIELSFDILNLPEWLTATPSSGSIDPVSTKTIHFTVDPYINLGDYSVDVNLLSGQGYNDKLIIDLHVFGVPPSWQVDPAAYEQSMNIVADVDISGELSDDPLDRVVAYVNGEVRGLTTLEYIPELDRYLGFLEVYSNVTSGEQVTFKVWDASTGTTFAGVNIKVGASTPVLQIPFVANTLVGNAVTPARWIVTSDIIQEIPMNAGWTWISFNVLSPLFADLDDFFAELNFEDGDQVLSQTKTATYNPSSGWQGNLLNPGLEIKKMYKCDFTYADVLRVSGPLVNPTVNPINIVAGWNWIPYLSRVPIEINEALSSFDPTQGDQVKSQNQFAVYHPTQGWVGTLKYMEPGKGYMLFADNSGTIIYPLRADPPPAVYTAYVERTKALQWRSGREHEPLLHRARNMTMIARLESDLQFDELPQIAAFAGDQLLQVCSPMQIEGSEVWSYYFTLQGDETDHAVHFEVYDVDGRYAGLAKERIDWDADMMIGTLDQPFVLHLYDQGQLYFSTQPNPFSDALEILLETSEAGYAEIAVFDIKGTSVYATELSLLKPGLHKFNWDGRSPDGNPISPGVYILHVRHAGSTHYEKLIKH